MSRLTRRVGTALAAVVVLALSACGGGGGDGGGGGGAPKRITVWTGDTLPDRVAATQAIIDKFTAATGIQVELVGVDEDQFNQTLTSAAAAGELPDVIGSQPLASVRTLAANELVDTAATAEVVEALGADTFDQRALELTRDGDAQLAVPSDAWAQLLYYRKDLFDAAGLPAPTTYDAILNAARTLNKPGLAGFAGATAAGDAFTQQTFEHIALANGCEMVDPAGKITIARPAVRRRVHLLPRPDHELLGARRAGRRQRAGDLLRRAGRHDRVVHLPARRAGRSAQRRAAQLPRVRRGPAVPGPQHRDRHRPAGPGRHPARPVRRGQLLGHPGRTPMPTRPSGSSSTCSATATSTGWPSRRRASSRCGPDRRRAATSTSPRWKTLPVGVDTEAPLAEVYGPEVLAALAAGPEAFTRWGITQGQGDLIGASLGELPVAAGGGRGDRRRRATAGRGRRGRRQADRRSRTR